jgi:surface protein
MSQTFGTYLILVFGVVLLFYSNASNAQELNELYIVGEAQIAEGELIQDTNENRDANGRLAAGLKVLSDLPSLTFSSNNGILKTNQNPGSWLLFLSPNERVFTIYSSGFEPKQIILNELGVDLKSGQVWQIRVTGNQADGFINVLFRVTPEDAVLTVNGETYTDLSTPIGLPSGSADIEIEAEGYKTIEETVTINEQTVLFEYDMQSIDPVIISITTNRPGATILIDGVEVGTTDNDGLLQLFRFPGTYNVTAELDNYVREIKEIEVTEVAANDVNFNLRKNAGTMQFDVIPNDAIVLVNGEKTEIGKAIDLVPGKYTIEISRSGYFSEEDTVTLQLGDDLNLTYNLVKNAGSLLINTTPEDATVLVNNQRVSKNTPLDFAPGRYRIEVQKAGYDSLVKDIVINRGDNIEKQYELTQQFGKLQFSVQPSSASVTLYDGDDTVVERWKGLNIVDKLPVGNYKAVLSADGYITQEVLFEINKNGATEILAETLEQGSDLKFYVAENGFTIICDKAEINESAQLNGVTYTKRSKNQINSQNAANTCTSGITDMSNMFNGASNFNQNISSWDVSSVINMNGMFYYAEAFNSDISNWDVSSVIDMGNMFTGASNFNQDLSRWDVSLVTNMRGMFNGAISFNQPINSWNISKVTDMRNMFRNTIAFNQDLSEWNVSSTTTMYRMFYNAKTFNQPLNGWDVSNVINMRGMFQNANSFSKDISMWCVKNISSKPTGFDTGSALINEHLPVWGTCPSN